jgi:peptidoglycan/LPS O-acetylase OafA/YrhL
MHDQPPQHRLQWLDYARFCAAFSVLSFHYLFMGATNGKIRSISGFDPLGGIAAYGYLGVDIFFIISGFVIIYSASENIRLSLSA